MLIGLKLTQLDHQQEKSPVRKNCYPHPAMFKQHFLWKCICYWLWLTISGCKILKPVFALGSAFMTKTSRICSWSRTMNPSSLNAILGRWSSVFQKPRCTEQPLGLVKSADSQASFLSDWTQAWKFIFLTYPLDDSDSDNPENFPLKTYFRLWFSIQNYS